MFSAGSGVAYPFNVGVRSGLPDYDGKGPTNKVALDGGEATQHRFDPYAMNGGTVLAIAGEDFAIIAGDTRLSEGYSIHSRTHSKTLKVSDTCVIATQGFEGDALTLHKHIKWRSATYMHANKKPLGVTATAQMVSTMLYHKRFFPYYTYNIIGGLDENGKGAVYSFDPVGSYERESYRAGGTGSSLLQPFLDSELGKKNKLNTPKTNLSKDQVVSLVKDAFTGVAERDIYTGDGVEIVIVTKDGITSEVFPLRRD